MKNSIYLNLIPANINFYLPGSENLAVSLGVDCCVIAKEGVKICVDVDQIEWLRDALQDIKRIIEASIDKDI